MTYRSFSRAFSFGISDVALECVMGYIDDPRDRDAVSLVCKKWYQIDAITRKHITIALCYSTTPDHLTRRFPRLESLKIKGQPRAAMFNLIPENWGGYAGPWISGVANEFNCLKSLHLRRMIVKDADLDVLVKARGHMLLELKMDKCSGFSTDGLKQVARSCSCLRTLFLEESIIFENDGEWLHELALHNSVLETLNFHMTELKDISVDDLELIAKNCRSLTSLKISDYDVSGLVGFFRAANALVEFGGGSFNDQEGDINRYERVSLPSRICRLGLIYMGTNEMQIVFPYGAALKKLDLQFAFLRTEDHCQLIQRCPNLEILEVRNVIGDRGLEVVAEKCKRLRRLRVESGEDEDGFEDEQGMVTQKGLAAIAQGCPEMEYLAVHVYDITNAALEALGTFSKNLHDFRMVLLKTKETVTELPLDNGVRALLRGCTKLRRLSIYLRNGGLTDVGMGYIGEHGANIRYMLLGFVGESDRGLEEFSRGCPNLQKLEMRGCCFSERALAIAIKQLTSLRYIWVQGYKAFIDGSHLLAMTRPFWNIETFPTREYAVDELGRGHVKEPPQLLAYHSLAGQRKDSPPTVIPIHPAN